MVSMSRQHATPILLPSGSATGVPLTPLSLAATPDRILEKDIQELVHQHPSILPIAEIDPIFVNPVAICQELATPTGRIDNLLVTPTGLPIIVECKLWRNSEARREIVGQILDYAKDLSSWSSSDLQREVRKLDRTGKSILELVRSVDPNIDETTFNDALTNNLRRGRFLLIIVGDGIRESVEAISQYLQRHAGLHFSLGLVELPFYSLPNGDRIVAPRVLARTHVIVRDVVNLPEGMALKEDEARDSAPPSPDRAYGDSQQNFWTGFISRIQGRLDDPEQVIPQPPRQASVYFMLPAPGGSCWLTAYRSTAQNVLGVFISSHKHTAGEAAMLAIAEDIEAINDEIGDVTPYNRDGRPTILSSRQFGDLNDPATREEAFEWLASRVNDFVNVARPRVKSAVATYLEQS